MKKVLVGILLVYLILVDGIQIKKDYTYVNLTTVGFYCLKSVNERLVKDDIIVKNGDSEYTVQLDYNF